MKETLRGCDLFGARIEFQHNGKTENGTVVGGVASVLLQLLTLAYFCMRLISVTSYEDPQITGYDIRNARQNMDDSLKMSDYSQLLAFGFHDPDNKPVNLEPRIGSFSLTQVHMEANTTTGARYTETDIPLKQMSDFTDGIPYKLMR